MIERPYRILQYEYAQGPMVVWEFREPRGLQALDRSEHPNPRCFQILGVFSVSVEYIVLTQTRSMRG